MSNLVHFAIQRISLDVYSGTNRKENLIRGCKAPLVVKAPFDLKLYGFNLTFFQAPLSTSAITASKPTRTKKTVPR